MSLPLAERLRPKTLDDYIGQKHLVGQGAILRQMIELDIISAYYYQAGSIEAGLQYDRQLKEAIRLLQQPEAYKKLLTPKKSA